jgi:hypothetical protein
MKQLTAASIVAVAVLASSWELTAHHSLARFDTTTPLWVKGTVVRFDRIDPHVRFLLDQTGEDGKTQRWAVDGPPSNNVYRLGIGEDFLKAGDVVEVCGFALKEEAKPDVLADRPFSGHLLVMPNGKRRFWSNYGVLDKCLNPGEKVETLRREAFEK